MKRFWLSVMVAGLLTLLLSSGIAYATSQGPFSVKAGPMTIVDPIVTSLSEDSPPIPLPGTRFEPGDSFTVKVKITNTSVARGYWVQPLNLGWGGPDPNVSQILLETRVKDGAANVSAPIYIPAGTTEVVSITVRIKEDSPPANEVSFFFGPPTRIDMEPIKG